MELVQLQKGASKARQLSIYSGNTCTLRKKGASKTFNAEIYNKLIQPTRLDQVFVNKKCFLH